MPTQQEIEYYRNRYQRMNKDRFFAANIVALVTHAITQPLDLLKVRAQMLQEGKTYNGMGIQRGYNTYRLFSEINKSGAGYKTWFTSWEGFLARTFSYTTARLSCYLWFFDRLNKDPRRYARPDRQAIAGIAGGLIAGIITNPIEIVFARMQVDSIYPKNYQRGYTSFYDGLIKTAEEGALFRGSIPNGCRVAGLITGAYALHDWFKENAYYFLGNVMFNRFVATLLASAIAVGASMPFDTIRMRLYTQRPLPNGVWPYQGVTDCLSKIMRYEANIKNHGNLQSFYAGFLPYFARYFLIFFSSQYILDFYHYGHYVPELWTPATYYSPPAIAFNVYEPASLDAHRALMNRVVEDNEEFSLTTPDMSPLRVV